MKPTPLLDFWQKPPGAGEPVALLATTFALDTDFFERNCLARFLEVSSVSEDSGSIEDVVAGVELHELLQKAEVTVLADRSAPVERTSLQWDLLSCHVDGGLLHAKVSVLLWENATRVIVGSANLTAAGYRRQIELGLSADLGPECLFPADVLNALAGELDEYLRLVPGFDPAVGPFQRAADTLRLFRARIGEQPAVRSNLRVAFAPTNPRTGPLDLLAAAWNGPQPLRATHLSPFWDSQDPTAVLAARKLLTGRPAEDRRHRVAVVLGPRGETSFSQNLEGYVDSVHELKALDQEARLLHAKCLLLESDRWVAALVGSANHTRAGLGLSSRRHREISVWLGAPRSSKEGAALRDLIELGREVGPDTNVVEPNDEDEAVLPALPICFELCRLTRTSDDAPWELRLGISDRQMPQDWIVSLTEGDSILTHSDWQEQGAPAWTTVTLDQSTLPMYVIVEWEGNKIPWAVIADDPLGLPPGPILSGLRAQQLLDALAQGRTLSDIVREELLRAQTSREQQLGVDLDPLKRFDAPSSLLRRGRALAASLAAMQRRLERPVITLDTLRARLAGPLGPEFVASKVIEAFEVGDQSRADAAFTVAEIALTLARVRWSDVLKHVDDAEGRTLVGATLGRIDRLRTRLGDEPVDLMSYCRRAIEEGRRCLAS